MRIESPATLEAVRCLRTCEGCGLPTPGGAQPHHLFTRGAGRNDARFNVLATCLLCHTRAHAEPGYNAKLIAAAARRERCEPEDIEESNHVLRRLSKSASLETINAEICDLSLAVQRLVWQAVNLRSKRGNK